MNIHEFVSQYTNYPILFIGTGISLRYLKDSYTWDSLLSKIASELYGNDEKYLDVKARCKDEHGNFQFNQVATIIEEDFNSFLMLPENRTGKFKKINDFYYEQMREHQRDISRFKIYLSQLLSPLKFKEEKENELKLLRSAKKNINSIITTNYDRLIESVFQFNPLIGNDILLSNPYGAVYKIHGCVDHPDKMVITSKDYDDFNERYELIRAQLLSLFIHNPIIFIGYRIQDDNIKKLLRTIFSYVEPNSELAKKIRDNFLLVEYENGADQLEISDYDVDIDGFPTIRINKIKTDNFSEIYKALSNIHLPVSAMDIKKVQSIVGEIVKGNTGIKVNITEDIDSLANDKTVLFIGNKEAVEYTYLPVEEFIAKYFKFIEEADPKVIALVDKLPINAKQYFPIYGFSKIDPTLACKDKLKKQQKNNIEQCLKHKAFQKCKTDHTSIQAILDDDAVAISYKKGAILWAAWNDRIDLDELKKYLVDFDDIDKRNTTYKRLLCAYDYKRFKD